MIMKLVKILTAPFFLIALVTLNGCGGRQDKTENQNAVDSVEIKRNQAINDSLVLAQEENTDIKVATIAGKIWMTENLNVSVYRNGDSIPEAKTSTEWTNAGRNKKGAWCYYDNKTENGEKTGKLYNFYAVSDPRGLAPEGWMIPSSDDFEEMANSFGVEKKAGANFRSASGWNEDGNGTNESGFSGLPGGMRNYVGAFMNQGDFGYWWSSSERPKENAWHFSLSRKNPKAKSFFSQRANGLSVRCVKVIAE